MARPKQSRHLFIYMNGILVGKLICDANNQLIFTYDDHWLHSKNTRPISLSLPLTEIPYKGKVVEYYFENLLPDNERIRDRIQARFHSPSKKCFDLLSFIGRDCIGALQLLTQSKRPNIKQICAKTLSPHAIAELLKHYRTAPLGMAEHSDFRISIAGVQEKTALLWHKNKWWLPQDATPTSHILKLPIGMIQHSGIDLSQSVENEWLCLQILSSFNLPVNQSRIMQFDDMKVLVVERFDRRWTKYKDWLMRLPQEDFCQALSQSSGLKYESDGGPGIKDIMNILLGAKDANDDRRKFMKSVFLFWVLGAVDGHAKNFSLQIESQGRYRLTPLYDVISAYPMVASKQIEKQKLKMAMSLKGSHRHYLWSVIQKRHWLQMAAYCQFGTFLMQEIIDEICDNMEKVIDEVSVKLPSHFPMMIADSIFSGMRQIKNRL